jgi:hypothetical protein
MKMKSKMKMKSIIFRILLSMTVLFITHILGNFNWSFSFSAAFFASFVNDLLDFLLSAMDGFPLSVGGDGSGASSSKRPPFDLNFPPADEPASTSDHGPPPLSEAEKKILFRLKMK